MDNIRLIKRTANCLTFVGVVFLFTGCASVPKEMQVRSGASPTHQDDNVRFRTTYYFRVLSSCGDKLSESSKPSGLETDSLYRFRMTGKANALTTRIHFESGLLHKDLVDPFGSVVVYDANSKQFNISSHTDIRRDANRKTLLNEIDDYVVLLGTMKGKEYKSNKDKFEAGKTEAGINTSPDDTPDYSKPESVEQNILARIKDNLEHIKQLRPNETAKKNKKCDNGDSPSSGFQILGPQGIRTYDADQRLILAMSTSAKPLIATLNETSARMMPRQIDKNEALLLITQEQLKLSQTERALDDELKSSTVTPESIILNVLNTFSNNDEEGE